MINRNRDIIISLCSHLCVGEGVEPLQNKEWSIISKKLIEQKKQPCDINNFSNDDFKSVLGLSEQFISRIKRLIDRSASLTFEIEKLNNFGITLITRADEDYPIQLKRKLSQQSPPIFYASGDLSLLKNECVGMVGSRTVSDKDTAFAKSIVEQAVEKGFSIVSGGAKGVDSVSTTHAIEIGGKSIEFVSDSMLKKLKMANTVRQVRNGNLLVLSQSKPDSPFNVGLAMQRNKYIYAQSLGTVVVKADLEKGGTWTGCIENLNNKWCHTYCWDNKKYKGNSELISKGATPIAEDFNFFGIEEPIKKQEMPIQQTMFSMLKN